MLPVCFKESARFTECLKGHELPPDPRSASLGAEGTRLKPVEVISTHARKQSRRIRQTHESQSKGIPPDRIEPREVE
jgi:hypothetical protein